MTDRDIVVLKLTNIECAWLTLDLQERQFYYVGRGMGDHDQRLEKLIAKIEAQMREQGMDV